MTTSSRSRKKGLTMPSKKYALLAAVLLSASGFGAFAADNEESLWGYADPSADVVIYINTKQPEKAMDKEVWDRIQKDKNQALKEKEEKGGGSCNCEKSCDNSICLLDDRVRCGSGIVYHQTQV